MKVIQKKSQINNSKVIKIKSKQVTNNGMDELKNVMNKCLNEIQENRHKQVVNIGYENHIQ